LSVWIGPDIAAHSAPVLQSLSVGALCNAAAQVPFAYIQGTGRVRTTALIHLIELPFYVLLLVVLTTRYGIIGTAIAWALRAALDLLIMSGVGLSLAEDRRREVRQVFASTVMPIGALGTLIILDHLVHASIQQRSAVFAVGIAATLLSFGRENWGRLGVGIKSAFSTRNRV